MKHLTPFFSFALLRRIHSPLHIMERGVRARRGRGEEKGFSLIELVIVVTLIGLVLAFFSIKFSAVSAKIKLQAVSKIIVSDLRISQQKASSEKRLVEIIFDYNSYQIGKEKKSIPRPIKVINPQTVAFSQSGQPIPGFFGTIILSDGKSATKIIISPIGRIRSE